MRTLLNKLFTLLLIAFALAMFPGGQGICVDCSKLDEPCSKDGVLGKCCPTHTDPATNRTFPLECKEDPDTRTGVCIEKKEK